MATYVVSSRSPGSQGKPRSPRGGQQQWDPRPVGVVPGEQGQASCGHGGRADPSFPRERAPAVTVCPRVDGAAGPGQGAGHGARLEKRPTQGPGGLAPAPGPCQGQRPCCPALLGELGVGVGQAEDGLPGLAGEAAQPVAASAVRTSQASEGPPPRWGDRLQQEGGCLRLASVPGCWETPVWLSWVIPSMSASR